MVLTSLLYAAQVSNTGVARPYSISSRNADRMNLRFVLPEFEVKSENHFGTSFQKIHVSGAEFLAEEGMPELPIFTTTIAIPHSGGVNVEVTRKTSHSLPGIVPYPVQAGIETDTPKSLQYNTSLYNGSTLYPATLINHGEPAIIRDFRVITIEITPFVWDAQTQELTVNTEIDFEIHYTSEPSINELPMEPVSISGSFAKIYESTILNFDDYRNLIEANIPPRYLVIYGNNSDPTYLGKIDEYVFWKRQKGADVTAVSTAVTGTSNTQIKTYIQGLYNNPVTRPDFIILIGDTMGTYAIPTHTLGSFPGDYPYTHLAGNDMLGDCFIGRISIESLTHLDTILAKGYAYEKNINISTADWLNRMLLVGDWSPSGISCMYISKYMKEISSYVNPEYTYTELYGSDPSPTAMNAAMNQGVGFFNYRGWLGMSGWSPNESSMFNGNRLPHSIIITCGTGNFNSSTPGTTEEFIRLGTAASPKGAVTSIGMATSSTHTSFNNTLNGGIINGIFTHGMRTMGEALLNGKLYLHQIYGVSSPSNAQNFAMMGNLMGDPTLEVFVGIPGEFTMQTDTSIPVGLILKDVAISHLGQPVEGASVTVSQGTTIISRGYTDVEGNVILILPENISVGEAVITVSKHNFKPLQQTIIVENSGTLVPGPIVLDDDNNPPSSGNANGIANNGETLELLFGLRNTGTDTISGISGYITTDSEYVTFYDASVAYPDTPGGELSFNLSSIVMHIAPECPHETMIRLHIILTDSSGNEYDISEFIQVESPNLAFQSYQIIDGGNQALDPGESSPFSITIQNNGTAMAYDLYGRLYSHNGLVSVTDYLGYFGDVAVGGLGATTADNFILTARPEMLPGMLIPMSLRLFNSDGFEQIIEFTLTVGVVTVHDPLGPCTYGYVIYDDNDLGYPLVPVYSWIGIAPAEGGQGTALAISDIYNSGNEGDQVGAQSLAVVNLPFPFQFYGRIYEQITVCSNGFIALGVSENAEFRNFRLPGAMGPNPMIAAFWDDLATHPGSGIYTWFDRGNNAFIIEWYNMKNGYNGSSEETFQIILYDQSVYSTSLGDGPIKIQYKVFNNVNVQSGNKHGNFSTIGIVDHTGLVGLEYTFNNQYPTAASPLGHERAIYITNIPVYHEVANLIIQNTYVTDSNGNNILEPGETVELGVQLTNSGNLLATNIQAVLSSNDPHITFVNSSSEYFPMAGDASGFNRTPFVFSVSPTAPNGHVLNFVLAITAGDLSWDRNFSIRIDASDLQYHSFYISDYDTNFNGIVDSGETVKLVVNLKNASDVHSRFVNGTLSTNNPFVNILNPFVVIDNIAPNAIMQVVHEVTFENGITPNSFVAFQYEASLSNGSPITQQINVPYAMPGYFYDLELDNGNFVVETGWEWGTPSQVTPYSGTKVWSTGLSGNYPSYVEFNLYSPNYTLTEEPVLRFMHYYGTEAGFDGANVSISTDNGNSWIILAPTTGYAHGSLPALNGEPGFSGTSAGWVEAVFNLQQFAGSEALFRFKFGSDGQNNGIGWFIDNIDVSGISKKVGFMHGVVIPTSGYDPKGAYIITHNGFSTTPHDDGSYRLYLKNGMYSSSAYMENHKSSYYSNVPITPSALLYAADFTLIHLPVPTEVSFSVNNDSGLFLLGWAEPYDAVLPVNAYRVYRKFDSGPYEMVSETVNMAYSEILSLEGNYEFYVAVNYLNSIGTPSEVVSFYYPYVSTDDNNLTPVLVTNLRANFPNPFNPTTTIAYDLSKAGKVQLRIYNVKGQLVKSLYNGNQTAGRHSIIWNGRDETNRPVASGVYFYRLETTNYTSTRKMLLMK